MSNVGKTLLRGHALRAEGKVAFNKRGERISYWRQGGPESYAMCECGLLSEPGISQSAAKRWHRAHKDSLRVTLPVPEGCHWDLCPHGVNCVHAAQVDDGRRGA